MTNFLEETLEALEDNKKKPGDVRYILGRFRDEKFWTTWREFESIASFDYDSGYGGNEISLSLKIVGDNWWLERGEYDGSEWWEFKTMPVKPNTEIIQTVYLKEFIMDLMSSELDSEV